jgi:hypothetical protein
MTRKKLKGYRHPPQRRGRQLQPGARYPGGKLKVATPVDDGAPNERMLEVRRAMLAKPNAALIDLRRAENPLDLAIARGWITPTEHTAGVLLAGIYAQAGIGLPRLRTQDLAREIRGGQSSGDGTDKRTVKAMDDLKDCAKALQGWPKCTAAMIDVCVLGEWPAWMIARINGSIAQVQQYEVGRIHLRTGLRIVGRVLGCATVNQQERRTA